MNNEKIRYYAYLTLAVLGVALLAYFFFNYALLPLLPFLIAWAIAFAVRRPSKFICAKTKIPERATRVILTLLITLATLTAATFGIWALARELWGFLVGLGEGEALEGFISDIFSGGIFTRLFGELGEKVSDAVYSMLVSLLSGMGSLLSGWISAVPKLFLFIIVTVVSAVYFSLDLEKINSAVIRLLPKKATAALVHFKNKFLAFGVCYIRSYLLLMLITFAIMTVGLMILGANYVLLLSAIIAFLDLLPVIGVGTVLVPWSLISIATGDVFFGVGLIVLLAVHEIIRQIAEPKILGKNLGVHPLLTLVLLYLGYSFFGILGLLLVPVFTVILDILFGKKNSAEVT